MKNTVVLVAFVLLAACTPAPQYSGSTGRAVFLITDAAADMDAVSNVYVTIDRVEMQGASQGWVTVSSTPKTYDLLELDAQGKTAVLADVDLKPGKYNQVRMVISDMTVVDAEGSHEATLPSDELKIVGDVDVDAGQTSTITFDFIADESLHTTGTGEYVMAPVVQVVTRENARVEVDSRGDADVEGAVKSSTKVGMDIKGNVGVGLRIGGGDLLSIDIGGRIRDDCICTAQYDPVCGSDKRTYSNACRAGCAGVTYSMGVCPTSGMTTINISSSSSASAGY